MANSNEYDLVPVTMREQEVRYLTEQEAARERLKASIDTLTEQASLQAQMQKEPLKMLGGASAAGAVVGLVIGRQFRRSKKIYVDADSPEKHQKALMKAQSKKAEGGMGGALVATLGTFAFKMVMDKVVTPRLETVADDLLSKAGQPRTASNTGHNSALPAHKAPAPKAKAEAGLPALLSEVFTKPAETVAPTSAYAQPAAQTANQPVSMQATGTSGVEAFLKPAHPGIIPMPESKVEAKAVGTPISETERHNPNA